jgi:hypothetical protein
MAGALGVCAGGTDAERQRFRGELISLIASGAIAMRLDAVNGTLVSYRPNVRREALRGIIESSEKAQQTVSLVANRCALQEAGLIVSANPLAAGDEMSME